MRLTLLGDMILSSRILAVTESGYLELAARIRRSDLVYGHLETLLHDYTGPGLYPSADAGWVWMRAEPAAVEVLRDLHVRLVSTAGNHTLDYGYGGIEATWAALQRGGIAHAGSGPDLTRARRPTYVDAAGLRVGLVSMSTTFSDWHRAADALPPVAGRPGLNPLGWEYQVGADELGSLVATYTRLGWWVKELDTGLVELNPPGRHNSLVRLRRGPAGGGITLVAHRPDREANLAAVRAAAQQADVVVVHLHNHEWEPAGGLGVPPEFVVEFAHAAVQAGASCVFVQGSHAPYRGVELYQQRPIFYDPGDFFEASDDASAMPVEFFERHGEADPALVADRDLDRAKQVRRAVYARATNPAGGYRTAAVPGSFVCMLDVTAAGQVDEIRLIPVRLAPASGVPGIPQPLRGAQVAVAHAELARCSEPFHTRFVRDGDDLVVAR